MNTTKECFRQILQLCWEVVNELREVNKMLIDDMPEEFSKVYEIADEIEDWLIIESMRTHCCNSEFIVVEENEE